MKKILVFILFGIMVFQLGAKAQEDQKHLYMRKIGTYSRMRNAGIGLTIGGGVLTIVGISVFSNATASDPNLLNEQNMEKATLGILTAELGCMMASGGIVFWTIGGSKRSKYMKKLNSLSLSLNPNAHQALSFAIRF
jgi:hypothetical protein